MCVCVCVCVCVRVSPSYSLESLFAGTLKIHPLGPRLPCPLALPLKLRITFTYRQLPKHIFLKVYSLFPNVSLKPHLLPSPFLFCKINEGLVFTLHRNRQIQTESQTRGLRREVSPSRTACDAQSLLHDQRREMSLV